SSKSMSVGMITDKNSTYGSIPAQGTTNGDPFTFKVSSKASSCGQSLVFSLKITTAAGTSTAGLTLRVGSPAGPRTPVVFQRSVPHKGLAIPDRTFNTPDPGLIGVSDSLAVSPDLVIHDLDFQIDSLTHPFVGQLAISLKAPNSFGSSMIERLAICGSTSCSNGQNNGANFINTRLDDSSANDLYSVGPTAAPFTGSWLATMNSPFGGLFS